MTEPAITFEALDRRLEAIPDGPAAVLNTPRWLLPFNLAGWTGALVGLMPSALILFMTPAMWMVWMARIGLWVELAGFLPGFVWGGIVLAVSFWHWRPEQSRQLDHDLAQFRDLRGWLSQFSTESRMEALQFARRNRDRLGSKLGLIVGSVEKLGILPVAVAVALQLKTSLAELGDTPLWQVLMAIFLLLIYAIGVVASLMRMRVNLYEMVLEDSLASQRVQTR